jgi:hypothetical protein
VTEPTPRLPWPPSWSRPGLPRAVATVVFLGLFGLIGVVAGVSIFLPGFHDARAYLLVLAAPLLFGVAAIVVFTRLRVRGRPTTTVRCEQTEVGGPGLVIPYSRGLSATYVLVCVTTLLLFAAVAVVSLIALFAPGPLDVALLVQSVVCLGFAGYLGWTVVEMVRERLRRGAVVVTSGGVWHRSWAFDSYLPWEQAVSVSAGEMDGQLITLAAFGNARPQITRRSRLWRQPEYKLAPNTAIRGMYLAVDPGLAFHTLRFYHQNPAARTELGTEAAVRRVRSGDVVTS